MIRNYGLTFSAVTLRLWLPLPATLGYDFPESYPTVPWLAWVPNLLVAQPIIGKIRFEANRQEFVSAVSQPVKPEKFFRVALSVSHRGVSAQ